MPLVNFSLPAPTTKRCASGRRLMGGCYALSVSLQGQDLLGEFMQWRCLRTAGIVAAGGWTESDENNVIYLFERASGKLVKRIDGLSDVVHTLAYSRDGRYLAAGLGDGGLRVFDRDQSWLEVSRDMAYEDQIYGLSFASDGRLAVSSLDGKIRLYDAQLKLILTQHVSSGHQPMHIAFDPNGTALAVGYDYTTGGRHFGWGTLGTPARSRYQGSAGWKLASGRLVCGRADAIR